MPDIVKFKSGNKSSLVDSSDNNILPIEAGTVYFTVDNNGKGAIYFDKDATHRILMTTALDTSLADIANKDGIGNVIHETYLAGIEFDGTTNTTKVSAILTYGDSSTTSVDLPTAGAAAAGIINTGAQTIAGNKTFTGALSSSGGATFSNSNFNYSGIEASSTNAASAVWFSDSTTTGKPVYDNDFNYNPSTNTLTVPNITGTASNAISDELNQNISETYLKGFSISNSTITLTTGDNSTSTLTAPWLLLTGGTVTGATTFSSTVTIDTANVTTATIGTLTVTGNATVRGTIFGNVQGNLTGVATQATRDGANEIIDETYLHLDGRDTMTGPLEINGHMAGTNATDGHGIWSGGGYHRNYNNIVLHGDRTTGSSGIVFISDRNFINIGQPSDRAFIQYHPRGITTISSENTNPTIATSGDDAVFVIGLGNDESDHMWLQTQSSIGLKHLVGTDLYTIPSLAATTTTAYYPVVSTTTAGVNTYNTNVTIEGGVVTALSFSGALSGQADTALWAAVAEKDEAGNEITDYVLDWDVTNSGNTITTYYGDGSTNVIATPWLPLSGGTVTNATTFTGTVTMSGSSTSITNLSVTNLTCTTSATFLNGLTGDVIGDLTGVADYARKAYGNNTDIVETYVAIASLSSTPASHILSFADGEGGNQTDLSTPYVLLAGDRMSGTLEFTPNTVSIDWRPDSTSSHTTTCYQTGGNEALVFATKNVITSFIFANGEDSVTSHSSTRWQSITPALQIKNNCVYIGQLIGNNITPDYKFLVNGHTHLKGKLIIDPSYNRGTAAGQLADSYNEGIRINRATNGWADIVLGGVADSNNGTADGVWIVGRRGAQGSYGNVGDFTIEEQGSNGYGLTIHKDLGGATLYSEKGSGTSSFNIINGVDIGTSNKWYAVNATDSNISDGTDLLFTIGKSDTNNNNKAFFGYHHVGDNLTSNYATIGLKGQEHVLNVLASGQVAIGTTTPVATAKLEVSGNTVISGNLSVGTSQGYSYITFYGLQGDILDNPSGNSLAGLPQWSGHDFIGNRKWTGNNKTATELFIFKGNDPGNGLSGTTIQESGTNAGPDRIRMAAAAHVFQTYETSLSLNTSSGAADYFEQMATSNQLSLKMEIAHNLISMYTPLRIHAVGQQSLITLCDSTNTGATGMTSNTWNLTNNNGTLYFLKGNTSYSSNSTYFGYANGAWTWNGIANATVARAIGDEEGMNIKENYIRMNIPLEIDEKDPDTGLAIDGEPVDMDIYNAAMLYAPDALRVLTVQENGQTVSKDAINFKDTLLWSFIKPAIWGGRGITDSSTVALNKVDKEDPVIYLNYDDPTDANYTVDKNIYDSLVALGWDTDCIVAD